MFLLKIHTWKWKLCIDTGPLAPTERDAATVLHVFCGGVLTSVWPQGPDKPVKP